jgi:hypothetical protein
MRVVTGLVAQRDHQRVMALDQRHEVRPLKRSRLDEGRQQPEQRQLRVEDRLDLVIPDPLVMQQRSHAVDRLLVQLDRRQHVVRTGQRRGQVRALARCAAACSAVFISSTNSWRDRRSAARTLLSRKSISSQVKAKP